MSIEDKLEEEIHKQKILIENLKLHNQFNTKIGKYETFRLQALMKLLDERYNV